MPAEMPAGADGRAQGHTPTALERALARFSDVLAAPLAPDQAAVPELSPDPTPRLGVKATRGGPLDAPIVQHIGRCPAGTRCYCPPVDVAAFQAKNLGIVGRGMPAAPKLMSKADLRSKQGSSGRFLKAPRPPLDATLLGLTDPAITLEPLPDLERVDGMTPIVEAAPTARPDAMDVHARCRREQATLHIAKVRAVHKLAQAERRIAALEAELAALKAPKRRARKRT